MFGSSDSNHQSERPRDEAASSSETGADAAAGLGKDLLNSVLRQTAQTGESSDAVTGNDLSALRDVAARYRGRPLVLEPVVVELVQAVLSEQFQPVVVTAESWNTMCHGIAQTLFDDPVSRDRLDSLWARLGEEQS